MDKGLIRYLDMAGFSGPEAVVLVALREMRQPINSASISVMAQNSFGSAASQRRIKAALYSLRESGHVMVVHGLHDGKGKATGSGYLLTEKGHRSVVAAEDALRQTVVPVPEPELDNRPLIALAVIFVMLLVVALVLVAVQ